MGQHLVQLSVGKERGGAARYCDSLSYLSRATRPCSGIAVIVDTMREEGGRCLTARPPLPCCGCITECSPNEHKGVPEKC